MAGPWFRGPAPAGTPRVIFEAGRSISPSRFALGCSAHPICGPGSPRCAQWDSPLSPQVSSDVGGVCAVTRFRGE